MTDPIFTIGYQGATPEALIATLKREGIAVLADVRAVPWSRRPDFAKAALERTMPAAGIGYWHLPALGNPAKTGAVVPAGADFRPAYRRHLTTPDAEAALAALTGAMQEKSHCLMCLERDPADCHRSILAEAVAARTGRTIRHLRIAAEPGPLFG